MAGTKRLKGDELESLLAEVEDSRRALIGPPSEETEDFSRPWWRHPAAEAAAGALVLALVIGVVLSKAKKRNRKFRRTPDRFRNLDIPRLGMAWGGAKARESNDSLTLIGVIVNGAVELFKPAVTQVLTRKAAGSLGSALLSGALKAVVSSGRKG